MNPNRWHVVPFIGCANDIIGDVIADIMGVCDIIIGHGITTLHKVGCTLMQGIRGCATCVKLKIMFEIP